jgi:hypothetical protein
MKKFILPIAVIALMAATTSCSKAPVAMTADQINKKADSTVVAKSKEMTENAGKECAANMGAAVKAKADQLLAAKAAAAVPAK